jgi:4-hydroxythreonine-4-phosphate dehydrogenase
MLVSGRLRAVHLTTHHPLIEACRLVTKERVLKRLELTDEYFKKWGFTKARIGVAALNPHGGEDGLMGREEIDGIIPAVEEAIALGIDARGPFPADSIYNRAIGGEFDVVLAMYHDQGHIPIKVFGFEQSVSVALGLPFIRTSVDHGTAFDIAGKGIADSRSMVEAIRVAVSLSERGRLG